MMMRCCVRTCTSDATNPKRYYGKQVTFHKIPKNLRFKWLEAIKLSPEELLNTSQRICSLHFNESDFLHFGKKSDTSSENAQNKIKLRPSAVPTRNLTLPWRTLRQRPKKLNPHISFVRTNPKDPTDQPSTSQHTLESSNNVQWGFIDQEESPTAAIGDCKKHRVDIKQEPADEDEFEIEFNPLEVLEESHVDPCAAYDESPVQGPQISPAIAAKILASRPRPPSKTIVKMVPLFPNSSEVIHRTTSKLLDNKDDKLTFVELDHNYHKNELNHTFDAYLYEMKTAVVLKLNNNFERICKDFQLGRNCGYKNELPTDYKCSLCVFETTDLVIYQNHLFYNHPNGDLENKPFMWGCCDFETILARRFDVKQISNLIIKHKLEWFNCGVCLFITSDELMLKKHLMLRHINSQNDEEHCDKPQKTNKILLPPITDSLHTTLRRFHRFTRGFI